MSNEVLVRSSVWFLLISLPPDVFAQKQEPYTKFIENNPKIQWAAKYQTIVNLTPVTNTISLKKYYLDRIRKDSVKSYVISNGTIQSSSFVSDPSIKRPDWMKDYYVRPHDHPERWEFRSRKDGYAYRISGFSDDPCCGCDEADAFRVNQLLLYSEGRFQTRNIFLSPLCLRKAGEETAAWFPVGNFAWNTSPARTQGATYLTTSTVTYKIDPYDTAESLTILTVGDQQLISHLMKDIQEGRISAYDPDTDKRISYDDLLTWKMPVDTVMVYDDDMNVAGHQVVQKVLDASDITSIRLEQQWYFDRKSEQLFSEVRSAWLMMNVRMPGGGIRGITPFVRLKFR